MSATTCAVRLYPSVAPAHYGTPQIRNQFGIEPTRSWHKSTMCLDGKFGSRGGYTNGTSKRATTTSATAYPETAEEGHSATGGS